MLFEVLRANKLFLFVLFVFSFLIRGFVFNFYLNKNQNYWQVDSKTYDIVAKQILSGNGISDQECKPCFYRLPGYPIFLAICYKLFGLDHKSALLCQIFLAALIPLLVFILSLTMFPTNLVLAKASGIYSAIHIGFVLYSGFFMTESLFIFLFLIFVILFFMLIHQTSCQWTVNLLLTSFCCGFTLGLASLVRPVGHYIIILSVLLIFFSNTSISGIYFKKSASKIKFFFPKLNEVLHIKIKKALLVMFGWIIPVSFWLVRNYLLTGILFFHTLPGGHFLYLSASRVAMHTYNCSFQAARNILKDEVDNIIRLEEIRKNRSLSEIEKCKLHEQLAIKYFKSKPLITLKNWVTDMIRASLSLYSAEIVYIESSRQEFDYFNKNRSMSSMFTRYLFPTIDKIWLKILIWVEILMYLIILIGLLLGAFKLICDNNHLYYFAKIILKSDRHTSRTLRDVCLYKTTWTISTCFICLFIVIALSGGYARMRLPIEAFLIILSLGFWENLVRLF